MKGGSVGSIPTEVIASLPTPCLVVDLEAADRNMRIAAAIAHQQGVKLRPHFKAHKCSTLLRRQVDAGGCSGVTCQTSQEAVILAEAGFADILIANQVVDRYGLAQLLSAALRATVTVAVDSIDHVQLLAEHVVSQGATLNTLIELDVGTGRCGLPIGSSGLIPIARAVDGTPGLRLVGFQAYEGHAVLRKSRALRRTMVWQSTSQVRYEQNRLAEAGFPVSLVSGGGTGTLDLAGEFGTIDEVQAGSYVLMDAAYAELDLPFENALYCIGTIVSRQSEGIAVANTGLKALTVEHGKPKSLDDKISVIAMADEHATLMMQPDVRTSVGDPIVLIPTHIDPTVNLYDVLFVWTGSGLETWPVDGRRRLLGDGRAGG